MNNWPLHNAVTVRLNNPAINYTDNGSALSYTLTITYTIMVLGMSLLASFAFDLPKLSGLPEPPPLTIRITTKKPMMRSRKGRPV